MSEVVGAVDRVIIVGAGIAGLAAASRLQRASIACVMLEARDRIGGRLHTIDLAGTPVDLGGSWIHHPIGNPMSALCDQLGIARDAGDPLPTLSAYDRAERRRLDRAETEMYARQESDAFWDAVDALSDRLGPDATGGDAIEAFVAERGLTGAVARRVRQALRAEIEADAADRADNNSLRWMTYGDEFDGGPVLGDLPRDGYRSVIQKLVTGLDVRLNTEVVSIEVDADGIRAGCADGSVESGSHAIVTVPLGVLKRGGPRFDPPLPAPVQGAVDALGFGRYEKIALRFESAFWRDDVSHLIVFPPDEDQPAMWVFDLDAFGAGPVLCAHLFHTLTPYALDQPPAEATAWLRDVLTDVFGRPIPDPIATAVTSWAHDPFTGGAYSHFPPGADPSMLDLLGEPLHGRLLLAGEHTQSARYGYADGAYVSGLRAAELLGLSSRSAD